MSPMNRALPKTPSFASHERLQYVFCAAPYIYTAFTPFIERFPLSTLLENERIYLAVCQLYVIGRGLDPECWLIDVPEMIDYDGIVTGLEVIRYSRRKRHGKRLWTHTRKLWKDMLGETLPSRRSRYSIEIKDLDEERVYLRAGLAVCLMRLFQLWDLRADDVLTIRKKHRPSARSKMPKKHTD